MKKSVALICCLILPLAFTACGGHSTTESKSVLNDPAYCAENNGWFYLILPLSQERIALDEDEMGQLEKVTPVMLRSAEESLSSQLAGYTETPCFYLTVEDGWLYLGAELIVQLDPSEIPNEFYPDHEHLFFKEKLVLLDQQ